MGRGSNKNMNFAKLSMSFTEDAALWLEDEENPIWRSAGQSSSRLTWLGRSASEVWSTTELVLGRSVFQSELIITSDVKSPVDIHVSSEDNESLWYTWALVPQGRIRWTPTAVFVFLNLRSLPTRVRRLSIVHARVGWSLWKSGCTYAPKYMLLLSTILAKPYPYSWKQDGYVEPARIRSTSNTKCLSCKEFQTHLSDKRGQSGLVKVVALDRSLKEWWVMNLEGFTIPNPRNDMIISFRFHVLQNEVQFMNERKMLVNRRIIVLDRYVHHLIVCHHLFSV